MEPSKIAEKPHIKNARKIFRKKGTCSQTMFYILNQEFENENPPAEKAVDQLAGGILQKGHQCGMLWGATMAAGQEAYKQCGNCELAQVVAIKTAKKIMDSFEETTDAVNCRDFTDCDFSNKWSMAKYMLTGRFLGCFKLAKDWAPEAADSALKGLSEKVEKAPDQPISCSAEMVKRLGGNEKEQVMASGLAGGMGLSGNGCGALAAAIWYSSLTWVKENPAETGWKNPNTKNLLEHFLKASGGEMFCHKITDRFFPDVDDHSNFLKQGGCEEIFELIKEELNPAN